ncbi:MAG: type IV secretory system conjugative DNA transfer family protein [Bacilli bacterium]|nr:type IV secretory system conjugative DNA transfer family protein [Bacilli bacterium]
MKFRISGKDAIYVVAFLLLLFYLCTLLTGNIHTWSSDGSFAGLNPFPGLSGDVIASTFIIFILAIILIFASVSSYVFERKDGIGLEIKDKESKGYNRWAKEKEMKADPGVVEVEPTAQETNAAGIPLINDGKKLWVDNGEYHNLVIGSTGSGKSQTCVEPMVELLIKKGESMIITDPKAELYRAASDYLRQRGYQIIVLNFRDPQNGNAWNPLTLPYQYYKDGNKDKATELLDDVASNILYDPNNKGEPFWEKSAADYFSGLSLGLFEDATIEEINLNSISYMSTVGEDKFAASNYIKEYFTMKGEASNAYIFASNTINAPTETKGGILSVFRQKIRQFASQENLSEMLAYSDFDMRDIGKQKTAVFIIVHDEKTTYHGLATIFIKQCYETLIDVAQQNGGKLPYRTNFILDEFANMPPLRDVTSMVTAARSRAIRFTFIIQNFAQLKSVYGDNDAETIKGNCGNLIYLISTELAALEEISKMCGEVKSDDKDKTASTPLVTVTDLQKLKLFEAIIIRWRLSPFKTKYTPNYKMNWGHPKSEASFITRQKREVKNFDIKNFVKEAKRKNMLEAFDKEGGGAPAGGGMGFDPFAGGGARGGINPFAKPVGGSSFDDGGDLFGGGMSGGNGLGGGLDLDAMMKDIDRKIAELDAEEARQKEEEEKKAKEGKIVEEKKDDLPSTTKLENTNPDIVINNIENNYNIDNSKEETKKEEDKVENVKKEQMNLYDDYDEVKVPNNSYNIFNTNIQNNEVSIGKEKSNIAVAVSSPDDDLFNFDDLPKVEKAEVVKPTYNSGEVVSTDNDVAYNLYSNLQKNNSSDDIKKLEDTKKELFEDDKNVINYSVGKKVSDSNKDTSNNKFFTFDNDIKEDIREDLSTVDGSVISANNKLKEDISDVNDSVVNFNDRIKSVDDDIKSMNEDISNNIIDFNNDVNDSIDEVKDNVIDLNKKTVNQVNNINNVITNVKEAVDNNVDKVNVNIDPDKVDVGNNVISDDEFFDDFFGDD